LDPNQLRLLLRRAIAYTRKLRGISAPRKAAGELDE
jgi:hypothetical protein